MQQFLTYQHNVQKFFMEHADKYQGVVIPLSIATSFPSGTYGFIRALCSRHEEMEYAIDPRNALFEKNWDRSKNVRPPHEKMASVFGSPYTEHGLNRALEYTDFVDDTVLKYSVERCLKFQKRFRIQSEDKRKLNKYKKLLGVDSLGEMREPLCLIPPYYQFDDLNDPWFDVTFRSIVAAKEFSDGIPLRPVIHFSQWNRISDWNYIADQLTAFHIKELWLYPNNFKEHEANLDELEKYAEVVELFEGSDLSCYSMFGGYFAILLSKLALRGFGNGVGYGEWRDSGYHSGGTAMTRIYLIKLHRYLDAPKAQAIIDQDPEYFGYDTDIIASFVESGLSLVDMSQSESLNHFMECRNTELIFVNDNTISVLVDELKNTIQKLKDIGQLEYKEYGTSLERWVSVLGQYLT